MTRDRFLQRVIRLNPVRVYPTRDLIRQFPRMYGRCGTLVGLGKDYNLIRVLVDGNKSASSYHVKYWRIQ